MTPIHESAARSLLPFVTKYAPTPWSVYTDTKSDPPGSAILDAGRAFALDSDTDLMNKVNAGDLTGITADQTDQVIRLALTLTYNRSGQKLSWHAEGNELQHGSKGYVMAGDISTEVLRWIISAADRIRITM